MSTFARLVAWQRSGGGAAAAPWSDARGKLPDDLLDVLRVANGDERALAVAISITGESKATLRRAALRFIREVLLARDASHYRKLGVDSDAPVAQIRKHYRELIAIFHPDRLHDDAPAGDAARASVINEAYNVLKRPHARGAYDRAPTTASPEASRSVVAPASPAAAGVVIEAHARTRRGTRRWKVERDPGAIRVWMQTRSPEALKRMSIGALVAVAASVIVVAGGRDAPSLALTSAPPTVADAARTTSIASLPREALLADLVATAPAPVSRGAPADRTRSDSPASDVSAGPKSHLLSAAASTIAVIESPSLRTQPRAEPVPLQGVPTSGSVHIVQSGAADRPPHAASVANILDSNPKGPPGAVVSTAAIQEPVAKVATPVPSSTRVLAPALVAVVLDDDPASVGERGVGGRATTAARSSSSASERSRLPESSAPRDGPSGIEVDAIVARFAVAFDHGDLAALLALVDPDAAQDDRIAFTLANFGRVFRETTSRRIELQVIQRTYERDQARIALAVKTTFASVASSPRFASGEMTLVIKVRAGVPVLTDVKFREGSPNG